MSGYGSDVPKKKMQCMFCMTGVYLRDLGNMIFSILHFSGNCVNIHSSCFEVGIG